MLRKYPDGKITIDDEGEFEFRVGALDGRVILDWGGRAVNWVGLSPSQARNVAQLLIKWASEAEQQTKTTGR